MTDRRFSMEIDPDAPGAIAIMLGARGPVWKWFVVIGLLTLAMLAVVSLVVILR